MHETWRLDVVIPNDNENFYVVIPGPLNLTEEIFNTTDLSIKKKRTENGCISNYQRSHFKHKADELDLVRDGTHRLPAGVGGSFSGVHSQRRIVWQSHQYLNGASYSRLHLTNRHYAHA